MLTAVFSPGRAVALLLLVLALAACGGETARPGETTVGAIVNNSDAFLGQQVTLRGEVESLVGEQAFRVEDRGLLAGVFGPQLLVVTPRGEVSEFADNLVDEQVVVSGVVRDFVLADVEAEYGLALAPELFTGFEGQPVLVADTVRGLQAIPAP